MSSFEFCFIYLNLSLLGGGVPLEWGAGEGRAGARGRQRRGGVGRPRRSVGVEGAAGPRDGGLRETEDPSSRV